MNWSFACADIEPIPDKYSNPIGTLLRRIVMFTKTFPVRAIWLLIMLSALFACTPTTRLTTPTVAPTHSAGPFHSDRFHIEVTLPPGWAAVEGPESLASPYTGLVAFNSWNATSFWAREFWTENTSTYSTSSILRQMPGDGAYIVLVQMSGGPPPELYEYGPEYELEDLSDLWKEQDCRTRSSVMGFVKWGRLLSLEVYCKPNASDQTATAVNALLASWRFDRVPVGDVGWAVIEASQLLPASVEPAKFPILSDFPPESVDGNIVRITKVQVQGETVIVTFMYRWDEPKDVSDSLECSSGRCHWWKFEARWSGEVVLVEEGGATLPDTGQ